MCLSSLFIENAGTEGRSFGWWVVGRRRRRFDKYCNWITRTLSLAVRTSSSCGFSEALRPSSPDSPLWFALLYGVCGISILNFLLQLEFNRSDWTEWHFHLPPNVILDNNCAKTTRCPRLGDGWEWDGLMVATIRSYEREEDEVQVVSISPLVKCHGSSASIDFCRGTDQFIWKCNPRMIKSFSLDFLPPLWLLLR